MSLPAFDNLPTVGCLSGLVVVATLVGFLYKQYQAPNLPSCHPLPPGPPARWFWQNALPSINTAKTFEDLVTEYGPVVTLRQGNQIVIVIGRVDAVMQIMEKEGAALADRPRSISAGELVSGGMRILFIRSGERFRRLRKATHLYLQPRAVKSYQDLQLEHAQGVITDIINDPKSHQVHARRYSASVLLRLMYGKSTPTSVDDPEVISVEQCTRNLLGVLRPGAFLVDRIPLLKYIPGYGNQLREYHNFELRLFRDQMKRVQSEMEVDSAGHSFMRMLLEHANEHRLSSDEMAYLAGNLFGAGVETVYRKTAVGITNMILAAACHPDAQRRVQEELDRVVGKDRMPNWQDSESLPQVHAFVSEALRWRPVATIGFAHRATQNIIWNNQCIPEGATVFGCHWAISRDPVAFPDPEKFDPQRWIDDNGRLRDDIPSSFPHGFGRRACPGQYLANNSLYINTALLLWSFYITEKPDQPIDIHAYTDGVISHPSPFEVEFVPRVDEGLLRKMMCREV